MTPMSLGICYNYMEAYMEMLRPTFVEIMYKGLARPAMFVVRTDPSFKFAEEWARNSRKHVPDLPI